MDEYIDVVFSDAVYSCLSMAWRVKKEIIVCDLSFNYGDISHIDDFNTRKNEYIKLAFTSENPIDHVFQQVFYKNLEKLKDSNKKIRIWASPRYSGELCGLYYLSTIFKDRDLYLVEVPVCEDAPHYDTIFFTECLNKNNIIPFHQITSEEKESYVDKWNTLVEENTDLRISHHTGVLSMYYESYYMAVSDLFNDSNPMNVKELISKCSLENQDELDYPQSAMIIKHMIDTGALTISSIDRNDGYEIYVKPVKVEGIIDLNEDETYKFTHYSVEDKEHLLQFLKSNVVVMAAAMTIDDRIHPEIRPGFGFAVCRHGPYLYSNEEIYHIEKYDVLITKKFNQFLVDHGIISKIYEEIESK